jgi:hypothetical protein
MYGSSSVVKSFFRNVFVNVKHFVVDVKDFAKTFVEEDMNFLDQS